MRDALARWNGLPLTCPLQEREQREKEEALERERRRIEETKALLQQKALLEEEQRKRAVEKIQREREVGLAFRQTKGATSLSRRRMPVRCFSFASRVFLRVRKKRKKDRGSVISCAKSTRSASESMCVLP